MKRGGTTKRGLAACLATVCLLSAFVQSAPSQVQRYGISSTILENGLEVIAVENHNVPLVTITIAVKSGACTEPPAYDGLSHLYEHMFFKGNKAISNQESYLERLRELGVELGRLANGSTSTESTLYFITLHRDNLEQGMIFMKDAIQSPLFDEEELEMEKRVVLAEYDRAEATPRRCLQREVDKRLWYKYPWRKDILGDREIITTATQDKMLTIQKKFYIPNNSALIIAGDIDPKEIFNMAGEIFADWQRREDPFMKYPVPRHPLLKEVQEIVIVRPVNTISILIGFHGPSVSEDERATYAADVLSCILNNPASGFQKNLVDSGLFTSCSVAYRTQEYTGPITIFAQTNTQNLNTARKALIEEVQRIGQEDYFSDEELENARQGLEAQQVYDVELASRFAYTLGSWWCSTGLDYYLDYIPNVKRITREDVEDYINTYITGKPFVIGVLLSQEDKELLT
jgi:zinc protease